MYTLSQINDAKSSPVYSPSIDNTDVELYNLMNQDPNQATIDEYTRSFMSLSTSNPYTGVLENPHMCDFKDTTNNMNDIKDKLNDVYQNGKDENGNPNKSNPDWIAAMDPSNKDSTWNQLFGDPYNGNGSPDTSDTSLTGDQIIDGTEPTTVKSGLDLFENHTNRMTFNIQSILGMVQSALGIASAIGNLLNPCTGLGDFFNSIMETGKQWMATIKKYINELMELLALPGLIALDLINLAVKKILDYIDQVKKWIKDEIKKLVKAMIKAIKNSLSGFLKGLLKDPCASFLLKTVTTGAAGYALGKIT